MSDLDLGDTLRLLNKIKNNREYHTPLVEDIDSGEYYLIKNIYVDEDDDIIISIREISKV